MRIVCPKQGRALGFSRMVTDISLLTLARKGTAKTNLRSAAAVDIVLRLQMANTIAINRDRRFTASSLGWSPRDCYGRKSVQLMTSLHELGLRHVSCPFLILPAQISLFSVQATEYGLESSTETAGWGVGLGTQDSALEPNGQHELRVVTSAANPGTIQAEQPHLCCERDSS